MYKGTNPKAITSQQMLSDGLIALIKIHPFNKINIKMLCDESLISRQTFYSLFDSKEEVIDYILTKQFERYYIKLQESQNIDIQKITSLFFEWAKENEEFLRILFRNNLMHLVCHNIKRTFIQVREILHIDILKINKTNDLYIMAFVAGALTETLQIYFSLNQNTSVEELSKLITNIFLGKYFPNHFEI